MAWTPELREQVKKMYLEAEPTPESSVEIIKDIADELEQSANGVRQVLIQEGVYVKKDPSSGGTKGGTTKTATGEGSKRVSKEEQHAALKELIEARGKEADEEIISKLTGKAAAYLVSVFK